MTTPEADEAPLLTDVRVRSRDRAWVPILVIVAVILALFAVPPIVITQVNDASARGVESGLRAIPLPEGAEIVDSLAVAGKLSGNGNGMQYLGALLVRTDGGAGALQAHYDAQTDVSGLSISVTGSGGLGSLHRTPGFLGEPREPGTVIVYAWGDGPGELFEQFDLRGH